MVSDVVAAGDYRCHHILSSLQVSNTGDMMGVVESYIEMCCIALLLKYTSNTCMWNVNMHSVVH